FDSGEWKKRITTSLVIARGAVAVVALFDIILINLTVDALLRTARWGGGVIHPASEDCKLIRHQK
ncbi:MAG: hypothetical protein DSZ21_02290, partial [Tenericutes bacterium]